MLLGFLAGLSLRALSSLTWRATWAPSSLAACRGPSSATIFRRALTAARWPCRTYQNAAAKAGNQAIRSRDFQQGSNTAHLFLLLRSLLGPHGRKHAHKGREYEPRGLHVLPVAGVHGQVCKGASGRCSLGCALAREQLAKQLDGTGGCDLSDGNASDASARR